mmetsp:Transcript_7346/g.10828  ORF Transcript_7346/g.10828 Transcript_7346/m.10828 type:complete len:390 (+) Transcript_7346:123-1292(+)
MGKRKYIPSVHDQQSEPVDANLSISTIKPNNVPFQNLKKNTEYNSPSNIPLWKAKGVKESSVRSPLDDEKIPFYSSFTPDKVFRLEQNPVFHNYIPSYKKLPNRSRPKFKKRGGKKKSESSLFKEQARKHLEEKEANYANFKHEQFEPHAVQKIPRTKKKRKSMIINTDLLKQNQYEENPEEVHSTTTSMLNHPYVKQKETVYERKRASPKTPKQPSSTTFFTEPSPIEFSGWNAESPSQNYHQPSMSRPVSAKVSTHQRRRSSHARPKSAVLKQRRAIRVNSSIDLSQMNDKQRHHIQSARQPSASPIPVHNSSPAPTTKRPQSAIVGRSINSPTKTSRPASATYRKKVIGNARRLSRPSSAIHRSKSSSITQRPLVSASTLRASLAS